jgi:hypothetical protein
VTLARRTAAGFAAFATAVLPAACSGADGDTGSDGATTAAADTSAASDIGRPIRLTLTEDDCAYEGPEAMSEGSYTADVENRSSHYGAFEIGELAEDSTLSDLEKYVARERKRWNETQELHGPPDYYTQVIRVGVAAGDIGLLPVDVDAGTHALTCFNDDLPVWRAYVAG